MPALETISRRELQAVAKEHGLKANGKSDGLISQLTSRTSLAPMALSMAELLAAIATATTITVAPAWLPSEAELTSMTWAQLVAHMRKHAAWTGAAHAELALRVVAARWQEGDAAVAAGIVPQIVAAMGAHPASVTVQEAGCAALINSIGGAGVHHAARAQAAVDAGALPLIVAAMGAHPASVAVQQYASTALCIITVSVGTAKGDARAQAAAVAGALPKIVAAMLVHPASAAVQEQACTALYNIIVGAGAQGYARRQAALTAGALRLVVVAMRAHSANAAVHKAVKLAHDILSSVCCYGGWVYRYYYHTGMTAL
ncbi:hypothetical protein T492DRAFT_1132212 [Pavlovales sp. CCMP2436]|nr:hypothetical protein T492DRAFT_1132212 [Pavlovales sp. CCMP2436]